MMIYSEVNKMYVFEFQNDSDFEIIKNFCDDNGIKYGMTPSPIIVTEVKGWCDKTDFSEIKAKNLKLDI